jgi:hypothetical protein
MRASGPVERFKSYGIRYEASERNKNEIYRDAVPLVNGQRCELLDNAKLINELIGLERRTTRGGRDSIDHAPHSHDDIANAVCGALLLAESGKRSGFHPTQAMIQRAGEPSAYALRRRSAIAL